jgi:membrane-bound serine protease (ClpP class)
MKQKVVSYLKARVRAISEGKGYRGEVISAMIDADYELKIGDKVIKPKGELLSLTASEANKKYGEPPRALLGAGIAKDIPSMLAGKYGSGNYEIKQFEVTWSEVAAQYLTRFSPILLGLGLLALFIEFKTPGFGVFGISGIVLLGLVFLSNYVAGFSGHEPLLLFVVGLLLVILELLFFPGVTVVAACGLLAMLGSLVWAMADLWPGQPITVAWSGDAFVAPLRNLGLGVAIAAGMAWLLMRFLPHGWLWGRLAVTGAVQGTGAPPTEIEAQESLVGLDGVAATGLFPSGQVEINGRRYEARVEVGTLQPGAPIRVVRRTGFNLVVEARR